MIKRIPCSFKSWCHNFCFKIPPWKKCRSWLWTSIYMDWRLIWTITRSIYTVEMYTIWLGVCTLNASFSIWSLPPVHRWIENENQSHPVHQYPTYRVDEVVHGVRLIANRLPTRVTHYDIYNKVPHREPILSFKVSRFYPHRQRTHQICARL